MGELYNCVYFRALFISISRDRALRVGRVISFLMFPPHIPARYITCIYWPSSMLVRAATYNLQLSNGLESEVSYFLFDIPAPRG